MIFSRKTTSKFSQSNAFIEIGWLKDAKNEYITVRSHSHRHGLDIRGYIWMINLSMARVLSCCFPLWAVAQQCVCTLPRKAGSTASSWPEFCQFLSKHSFSVGMKPSKHAGNRGRCSSDCFTQRVELYISSTALSISFVSFLAQAVRNLFLKSSLTCGALSSSLAA